MQGLRGGLGSPACPRIAPAAAPRRRRLALFFGDKVVHRLAISESDGTLQPASRLAARRPASKCTALRHSLPERLTSVATTASPHRGGGEPTWRADGDPPAGPTRRRTPAGPKAGGTRRIPVAGGPRQPKIRLAGRRGARRLAGWVSLASALLLGAKRPKSRRTAVAGTSQRPSRPSCETQGSRKPRRAPPAPFEAALSSRKNYANAARPGARSAL